MKPNRDINVCVFAASSERIDAAYAAAARELGQLLAERGWGCVNGAGAMGLMRALSDAVLDHGGRVVGVIPQFMVDNGWCHNGLTQVVVTADMHERKQTMQRLSQAFVALPGGCGTLEELLEALTWRQLGLAAKPIVLLNTGGYYDPLVAMLQRCVDKGFMRPSHTSLWAVAATARQAIDIIDHELSAGTPPAEAKN